MSCIFKWNITIFLKVYIVCALATAAILSHPALSFIPIILLGTYLFFWQYPIRAHIHLLVDYFMLFTIAVLLAPFTGPFFSLLISLPVLVPITKSLQETAAALSYQNTKYTYRPTNIGIALPFMAILALFVSLFLGNLSLLLVSLTLIVYFGILGVIVIRKLHSKPIQETTVYQRMVAGTEDHLTVNLTVKTKIGGILFFVSPYEWLQVNPNTVSLTEKELIIDVSLSPPLLVPSTIRIKAYVIDRWGLVQTQFEVEPIDLHVIPRAKYAAWSARKYLSEARLGTLPLITNISVMSPLYDLRGGVEYYRSQLYQSGDSFKNIDWKHSLQYNELITKKFTEFYGRPAIVLINLTIGDAEEADKLIYKILAIAMSLAQENIPTALAAYDHEHVELTTMALQPRQLLLKSLKIIQSVTIFSNPMRYLEPLDVTRLRANINRIRSLDSEASRVLLKLLQLEYNTMNSNAKINPASQALSIALNKAGKQSNVVVISQHNHDAEALALNTFRLARKGNKVITI